MNPAVMKERIAEASSRFQGRIACIYYLLTIVTGIVILFIGGRLGFVLDIIAAAFYVAVTALFYALSKGA